MKAEGIGDAELVNRVQQGDTDSFEVLVRRHQKAIFNIIYRLLGDYDEASEVAQEVFLSAYKAIAHFRGDANFYTWLYRIAFNQASTRRKRLGISQQRHLPLATVELSDNGCSDPAKTVERKELQRRVQGALDTLDKEDAMIILLRDLQDFAYEDVAVILKIPLGTVKSRLHRARRALKTRLAPYFYANRKAS